MDELALSRQAYEEILSAKNRELEVTKVRLCLNNAASLHGLTLPQLRSFILAFIVIQFPHIFRRKRKRHMPKRKRW